MQHEQFHDTTNLKKRKPNRLRGTPANKYSYGLATVGVLGFAIACDLYTNSKWAKPRLERLYERVQLTEFQEEQRLMMSDFAVNSMIKNLRAKKEGIVREDNTVFHAAEYN